MATEAPPIASISASTPPQTSTFTRSTGGLDISRGPLTAELSMSVLGGTPLLCLTFQCVCMAIYGLPVPKKSLGESTTTHYLRRHHSMMYQSKHDRGSISRGWSLLLRTRSITFVDRISRVSKTFAISASLTHNYT